MMLAEAIDGVVAAHLASSKRTWPVLKGTVEVAVLPGMSMPEFNRIRKRSSGSQRHRSLG